MLSKINIVDEILEDISFSTYERTILRKFADAAKELVKKVKKVTAFGDDWNIEAVTSAAAILKTNWTKESYMSVALWCLFFAITAEHYPITEFKYQTVDAFLEAYEGRFFDEFEPSEQEILKDEANWYNVVSTLMPPRKNKGLTIQVVPRLVEGWYAKYVTGSGQTKATADRVFIFETEGDVVPCHRGGRLTGKSTSASAAARKKRGKLARQFRPPLTAESAVVSRLHQKTVAASKGRDERILTRRCSKDTLTVSIPSTPGPYASELEPYQFPHVYDYPDNTDAEFDDVSVMSSEHRAGGGAISAVADSENIVGGGLGRFGGLGPPTLAMPGMGNHGVTSFQPLFNFDFGFSSSTIGKAGCAAPPFLKRAFSWESNNGTTERPSCDQEENLVNRTISPSTQQLPSVEEKTQKAPIQDFLFDAYLSTTSNSNSAEQQDGTNIAAKLELKEQKQSSEQQ